MNRPSSETPKIGRKQRMLLRLERFSRQRYGLVFLGVAIAVGLGIYFGSKLTLESDILALIPAGNRQVDTFKDAVEDFGSISYLVVLLEAREEAGAEELEEFADTMATGLTGLEELVEQVDYRFRPDAAFLELFYENALLFLPPERLSELEDRLSDEAIERQMQQNKLLLSAPTAAFTQELMVKDPLALMPLFLNRLLGNRGLFQVDLTSGYYLSQDGKSLIMLVKPTRPWQELDFNQKLLDSVRALEIDVREQIGNGSGTDIADGVQVHYGGHYAMAVDEAGLIRSDIRFNLIVSLLAVSMLYWVCYRRFAALLYSSLPLMVGQALTFGVCYLVLRSLNASSSAFTALLMGLGTDFVIVMYARYVEERQAGRSLAEATERMVGETGLGVFTGAITSAGTFYAMCISEFRGLRDLGFLIGTGILLCAVVIVFLVPAMITWNEGVRKRKVESIKKLHVQSFFIERLIPLSAKYRGPVIAIVLALTAISGYLATRLDFDDSVRVLRSDRSPAYEVQELIAEKFGASLSYMMAIAESDTLEGALELTEKIQQRVAPFLEDETVVSADSILSYLPPRSQQEAVLARLREDDARAFDPERVRGSFVASLDRNGFRAEPFDEVLDQMERFLTPERPIEIGDLERQGIDRLVERYISRDEEGVQIVTYLSMRDPRWKRRPPPGLVQALTANDPEIVVTGSNVVAREFRRIFSKEAPRAVLLGLLVVFVLLWVDFRSLRLTAIAMFQLLCGVILMLGMMKVANVHLNYVNAFVATMILGVGIDYSIHLVHRMSWSQGRVEPGLLETGKAVVIAALTNIAGFFTLTLGNYPALRSFGLVALFGSIACLFTSLTLVPAIMARPAADD